MSTLVCCRDTLRLRDNPLLDVPGPHYFLLCLEPHLWTDTQWTLPRLSKRRQAVLTHSIRELRRKLRESGGDLIVRKGSREHWIPTIAKALKVSQVVWAPGCSTEEKNSDRKVCQALKTLGIRFHRMEANGLFSVEDLPFDLSRLPRSFTGFRKRIENHAPVPMSTLSTPDIAPLPDTIYAGEIPTCPLPELDPRALIQIRGGENEARAQLNYYCSSKQLLGRYKKTRNGLLGRDFSSKLSPYLATGSLSPRTIWHAVTRFENNVTSNESTYWLKFEVLWREYFRWWTRNQGAALYQYERSGPPPSNRPEYFEAWCNGETGVPFIDANMKELVATGFMSNRGRQNVASYLVRELDVDWRWGAAFFEQHLVDYDVASNWGNWASVAGVGPFQSKDRGFNILLQATRYDKAGHFVRHWLPDLKGVSAEDVHWPWVDPGHGWKEPLVSSPHWQKIIDGNRKSTQQGTLPLTMTS